MAIPQWMLTENLNPSVTGTSGTSAWAQRQEPPSVSIQLSGEPHKLLCFGEKHLPPPPPPPAGSLPRKVILFITALTLAANNAIHHMDGEAVNETPQGLNGTAAGGKPFWLAEPCCLDDASGDLGVGGMGGVRDTADIILTF